jgi:uncharacterized membrane protein YfcA
VINLPDSATFLALLADRRIVAAAAIALISGLVRGFSGFGSALIYMPLISAVYEPRIAAVTLLAIDFVSSTPFTIPEFRRCTWREVLPLAIASAVAVPFGTWALLVVNALALRWGIAILVLALLGVMASGWRYRGEPKLPITIGVGLFAGFGGGAVQIAGPAVIIYWLSRGHAAQSMRANLMVFFTLIDVMLVASYAAQGLFTTDSVALSVLLGIPFVAALALGVRMFHGTSDRLYRNVAYAIIGIAALLSLPVLDPILR